jgi:very-short-patch-repair endonuclease
MDLHQVARHDVVSSAEANELGLDAYAVRQLVRAGTLRRLIRGWYAVHAPGTARPPWEGESDFDTARRLHRLLTIALLRSFEGRVVASHQSALVLHACRLWLTDLTVAHVARLSGQHTRHRPRAVIHPESPLPCVTTAEGFVTVPVAVAVVQVGLYPPDLSAERRPFESLIAADGALHDGLITPEELEEAVDLHAGHPGIHRVRRLLAHADGRHESAGETRLAHVLRGLGLRFTAQVWVSAGGQHWRVDFMLDDAPVIIEFDGLVKYEGLEGRDALAAEKWREDQLRGEGHQVVRVVWADLDDPGLIGARIAQAVSRLGQAMPTRSA